MIDTSSWVTYKGLDYSQFENSMNRRIYAASMEEERPYWFFVATKGVGPRALLTTVSLEFLDEHIDGGRMGAIAINLCLKNTSQETVFKFKSVLEESGFWAPGRDEILSLTSSKTNFDFVRGYFADVETTDPNVQQLDVELDAIFETIGGNQVRV